MKTKVVHCKMDHYDVYIGRPSIFGNPFSHKTGTKAEVLVPTREEAVEKYRQWINGEIVVKNISPPTLEQIKELKGKVLGCWCYPHACHGDILAEICNSSGEEDADSRA